MWISLSKIRIAFNLLIIMFTVWGLGLAYWTYRIQKSIPGICDRAKGEIVDQLMRAMHTRLSLSEFLKFGECLSAAGFITLQVVRKDEDDEE